MNAHSGRSVMSRNKLISRSLWSFPSIRFPFSIFDAGEEEGDGWLHEFSDLSGLSVSEDENHVFVEAALPGIKPDEIETTFDKGILWIKAEKKEGHDGTKKYYRKAASSFSYRVAIPGSIDENRHPEAVFKDGMITVTFEKTKKAEPKKIAIRTG